MNSLQIECFLAVSESLSFTAAAERLFTVQPAISRQVQALEKELDIQLIDRSNKNSIRLTEAGKIYRELFLSTGAAYRKAAATAAKAAAENKRSIRIGVPEEWDIYTFVLCCGQVLKKRFPELVLEFEAREFRRLYELLEGGHLDLIFCVETTMRDPGSYSVLRIAEIRQVILLSVNNPLASSPDRTLSRFRDEPLYVLPETETPLSRSLLLSETASLGFSGKIIELPNRPTILLHLDSGVGYTMFDEMNRYARSGFFVQVPYIDDVPICAVTLSGRRDEVTDFITEQMTAWLSERFAGQGGKT